MAHFVPLQKLPSAKETAQLLIQHVFHLQRLPMDVVSDRSPQFSSLFWTEFFWLVGETPSLSLGFYPQSNGQTECLNQDLEVAPLNGLQGPCLLVLSTSVGGICTQHPAQFSHRDVGLSVCVWLPTPSVPCTKWLCLLSFCLSLQPVVSTDVGSGSVHSPALHELLHGSG